MRVVLICTFFAAMPLVLAATPDGYREMFERALAESQLLITKAALWLQMDHGQLRRMLNAGTFPGWREQLLPVATLDKLCALKSDAAGGTIVTGPELDRYCRLFGVTLRPARMAATEER